MKAQITKAIADLFDINPIMKLWLTSTNNSLLCQCLSEYMRLVEIIVVSMLGSTETYFLHSCIYERQIAQLVKVTFGYDYSHVCTRVFYSKELRLPWGHYQFEISKNVNWCYHLRRVLGLD